MFEVVKYRKIMILFFNGNIKPHTEMNEKLNINTVTLNTQGVVNVLGKASLMKLIK